MKAYIQVRERDQHRCQFPVEEGAIIWRKCGRSTTHAHHRLRRSQGGPDTLENLILLCPEHHTWVHDHPEESGEMGLLIFAGQPLARYDWMDDVIPEDGYFDDEEGSWNESGEPPW